MNTRTLLSAAAAGFCLFTAPAWAILGPDDVLAGAKQSSEKDAEKQGPPPVFSTMDFDKALETTKGTDKVLVVKFTAEWCGPCKMMDRTTWREQRVVDWFKARGLALQVDVDKQPGIAERYGVRAMPTMVMFRNGEMGDRTVGYRDANALLKWMENAGQGKTEMDAMEADARRQGDNMPIQERLNMARSLVQAEKFDKATREYLWLWEHMLEKEPAMYGVRLSFMAGDIEDLCAQDKAAHAAFGKVRDEAEKRLKGENKSWDDLTDWITLNSSLRENDKTLAWYDRIKDDPESAQTINRYARQLREILEEKQRWPDIGKLVKNPVADLQREHQFATMRVPMGNADEKLRKRVEDMAMERFRSQAADMYFALLAAGRTGEADKYAAEAVKLDDTSAMRTELVNRAVEGGQTNDAMLKLLDDAEKAGADVAELRRQVKAELAKRSG